MQERITAAVSSIRSTWDRAARASRAAAADVRGRIPANWRTLPRWLGARARAGAVRMVADISAGSSRSLAWYRARRAARPAARLAREEPTDLGTTIVATAADDVASIVGRIDTAAEVDVVLVVPRRARLLRQPGTWAHVAAHVRRRGITLRVLAARRDVRADARANGLAAAASLRSLRRARRRRVTVGEREFELPAMPGPTLLRFIALFGVVALAFIGGCYAVPTAEIVIVPPSTVMTASASVRVNPIAEGIDVASGVVPGESTRHTVTTVVAKLTTGTGEVGDTPATAVLLFVNTGDAPVVVTQSTLVRDEGGVTFATAETIIIEPDGTATVTALADRPGLATNVEAGTLRSLSGYPASLTVTNPSAAVGGTNREVPAVAAEDVEAVRDLATQVLRRIGEREITEAVTDGTVFAETITVAILSETPLQNIGEPAEVFMMEYTAIVTALVLSDATALEFGEALLIERLPEAQAFLPGTTAVTLGEGRRFAGGELTVSLAASGLVAELFDPSLVRGIVTAVRPETAAIRLQERLALEELPVVTVKPEWIPWYITPRRGSSISIVLAGPTVEEPVSEQAAAEASP